MWIKTKNLKERKSSSLVFQFSIRQALSTSNLIGLLAGFSFHTNSLFCIENIKRRVPSLQGSSPGANYAQMPLFSDRSAQILKYQIKISLPRIREIQDYALNSNPFPPSKPAHALWVEQVEYNFPLSVCCACLIKEKTDALGLNRVLFATRDTLRLKKAFDLLFKDVETEIFFTSRKSTRLMSPDYKAYCKKILETPCLIVDGHGTGTTFGICFNAVNIAQPFVFVCGIGGLNSLTDSKGLTDDFERINACSFGTLLDFAGHQPLLAPCEYPADLVTAQDRAFDCCIEQLQGGIAFHGDEKKIATMILRQIDRCSASRQIMKFIKNH